MPRPRGELVAALLIAIAIAGCRDPTQITVEMKTDVPCSRVRGTAVVVGSPSDVEGKSPTTSSTFCGPDGDLGALVIVPSGGENDEVGLRVIAGIDRDTTACEAPPYGRGCIVARRSIRFVPQRPLRLSVPLKSDCVDVVCSALTTCVRGACVKAAIDDPGTCEGSGCGETTLGPAPPESATDGGTSATADAGPGGDAGVVPPGGCLPNERRCDYSCRVKNGPSTNDCLLVCNPQGTGFVFETDCGYAQDNGTSDSCIEDAPGVARCE